MFNQNIYWQNDEVVGMANKWSWVVNMIFTGEDSKPTWNAILKRRIYSIGSMPTKEMKVVNTYQGGIRMTHPGRVYYNGELEFQYNEDINFMVTKIFYKLMNSRFANLTIMDENYPYKDSDAEIYNINIKFYDSSKYNEFHSITFHRCWVSGFEYLNNLETKNEEEDLKCKVGIKYNYYVIDEQFEGDEEDGYSL